MYLEISANNLFHKAATSSPQIDNIHSACAESSIGMLRADIDGPTLKMRQFNYVCVYERVRLCV